MTYKCNCPVGFAADDCSIDINECEDNQCENNSTCLDLIGKYECKCTLGYEGEQYVTRTIDINCYIMYYFTVVNTKSMNAKVILVKMEELVLMA